MKTAPTSQELSGSRKRTRDGLLLSPSQLKKGTREYGRNAKTKREPRKLRRRLDSTAQSMKTTTEETTDYNTDDGWETSWGPAPHTTPIRSKNTSWRITSPRRRSRRNSQKSGTSTDTSTRSNPGGQSWRRSCPSPYQTWRKCQSSVSRLTQGRDSRWKSTQTTLRRGNGEDTRDHTTTSTLMKRGSEPHKGDHVKSTSRKPGLRVNSKTRPSGTKRKERPTSNTQQATKPGRQTSPRREAESETRVHLRIPPTVGVRGSLAMREPSVQPLLGVLGQLMYRMLVPLLGGGRAMGPIQLQHMQETRGVRRRRREP